MKKQDIIKAYVRIREIDSTIPDEVLDFMKEVSLQAIDDFEKNQKIEGFKVYRHEQNPEEQKFHDTFFKEHIQTEGHTCPVDLLIFPPSNNAMTPIDYLSNREKRIVLTTVQWLGTRVGQTFLNQCGYFKKK